MLPNFDDDIENVIRIGVSEKHVRLNQLRKFCKIPAKLFISALTRLDEVIQNI